MRKIRFLFIFILFGLTVNAQKDFEGMIEYDVKVTVENSKVLSDILPYQYTVYYKGKDIRIENEGGYGVLMGDLLYLNDSGNVFMLQSQDKIAYKIAKESLPANYNTPAVTESDKEKTIAGYKCKEYEVIYKTKMGETKIHCWAAPAFSNIPQMRSPFTKNLMIPGIEGLPLLIVTEKTDQNASFTLTIRATKVTQEKMDASSFKIPNGYKIEPYVQKSNLPIGE